MYRPRSNAHGDGVSNKNAKWLIEIVLANHSMTPKMQTNAPFLVNDS